MGMPTFAQLLPPSSGPPIEAPAWLYSVRPGDTLIALGQRYLADPSRWDVVQRLNRVADPHRIPPGTVLRIPASLLQSKPGQATLKAAHGSVRWRPTAQGDWTNAATGQSLPAGAEVQTGPQASATLELANGTQLRIHPGSTLALDMISLYANGLMADTRVRLLHGQTEISDNPARRGQQHLRVITPGAQAVVRGTVFRVGVSDGATREETVEGSVAVTAAGNTVMVAQAQGTVAREGQAPLAARRLPAAPDVSQLPARMEQLPLRFVLPARSGERKTIWWAQVSPTDTFDVILAEKTAASGAVNFEDLPNGRYFLRVRAVDEVGLQGLEARHPFTVFARPFAPALRTPGHSATVRSARPELSWTSAVGAGRYRVQLSPSNDFSKLALDQMLENSEAALKEDLVPGGYHWRVASITAEGEQGPWSAPAAFTYKPAPGQPDLGKAALRYEGDELLLDLPPPPADQHYKVSLSTTAESAGAAPQQASTDGQIRLPRPSSGTHFLGVRLVDNQDGTAGPPMLQQISAPSRYPYLWLLGLPLLLVF
jgi:hypothetical protein